MIVIPSKYSSIRFIPEEDFSFNGENCQLGEFTGQIFGDKAYGLYRPHEEDYLLFQKSQTKDVLKAFSRFIHIETFEEVFELFDGGIDFLKYPDIVKNQAHQCFTSDSQYNLLGSLFSASHKLTIGGTARIEFDNVEYLVAPLDDIKKIQDLHEFLLSGALDIEKRLNKEINWQFLQYWYHKLTNQTIRRIYVRFKYTFFWIS